MNADSNKLHLRKAAGTDVEWIKYLAIDMYSEGHLTDHDLASKIDRLITGEHSVSLESLPPNIAVRLGSRKH